MSSRGAAAAAGTTSLSVNLPPVALPATPGAVRLLLLHRNTPGVLASVNGVLADHGINVEAQVLGTRGPLGYVVTDVAAADDLTGPWVPQLDAAQIADDAAASGYSARHRDRAGILPVLLLRGDDVTADDLDDGWWLTVAAQGFADEAAVQQWCAGAGLAPPACVPRQLAD